MINYISGLFLYLLLVTNVLFNKPSVLVTFKRTYSRSNSSILSCCYLKVSCLFSQSFKHPYLFK
jgi:hypothetical protein